jgi:hypothetical protein
MRWPQDGANLNRSYCHKQLGEFSWSKLNKFGNEIRPSELTSKGTDDERIKIPDGRGC